MGKRDERKRREKRRVRRSRERAEAARKQAEIVPGSTLRRTFAFRSRSTEVTLTMSPTVQSDGQPLTANAARARLLEHAMGHSTQGTETGPGMDPC